MQAEVGLESIKEREEELKLLEVITKIRIDKSLKQSYFAILCVDGYCKTDIFYINIITFPLTVLFPMIYFAFAVSNDCYRCLLTC